MCYRSEQTEMFRFKTVNFLIVATIEPDHDVDISFDETNETRDNLESGKWQAFGTIVTISHNGIELGQHSLWGSIYADPRDFFTSHRDSDPMNRNCSIMRKARGDAVLCHYFPDMIIEKFMRVLSCNRH
jgi:hypothetical protein